MAAPARISFLGFPTWGPLHLLLPDRGGPVALADRFRQIPNVQVLGGPALLRAFLQVHRDLEPLLESRREAPAGRVPTHPRPLVHPRFRHRVACRVGRQEPLEITSWWMLQATRRGWHRFGPMPLGHFLERFASADGTSLSAGP